MIILVVGDDKEYGEGLDEIAHEFAVVADFLHFQYISVDIQCEGTDERFLEGVLIPDVGRPFPNDIEEPRDIFLHQTTVGEEENRHNLEVLLGVIDVSRLLQLIEKMLEELRCGAVGKQFVGLNTISKRVDDECQTLLVEFAFCGITDAEKIRFLHKLPAVGLYLRQVALVFSKFFYPLPALAAEGFVLDLSHEQQRHKRGGVPLPLRGVHNPAHRLN